MAIDSNNVHLTPVPTPELVLPGELPQIPLKVYEDRLTRVRRAMEANKLDALVIYADREYFANFQYLTGIEPRFEEGLLIVRLDEPLVALLGNESLTLSEYTEVDVKGVHYPAFSLPNQPKDTQRPLIDLLRENGITANLTVGVVGSKIFENEPEDVRARMYDVPAFIMEAIAGAVGSADRLVNATGLFIAPDHGLRTINEAAQIAVMEYGASLASTGVQNLVRHIRPGISELELAEHLVTQGLPVSCHPMVSTGEKAWWALNSPSSRRVSVGDEFTTAFGVWGGLTCRAGYVAETTSDLRANVSDWVDRIVRPYYAAVASWYETVGIGVTGGEMYEMIGRLLPKETFGWQWNPGHLISMNEWLSSPIYAQSTVELRSGYAIQMDIIPFPDRPYYGSNAEDGIVLADEQLRKEIEAEYPDVWARMMARRKFMIETLGINLKPEVLPMSNAAGLYRPLMLNSELAMAVRR